MENHTRRVIQRRHPQWVLPAYKPGASPPIMSPEDIPCWFLDAVLPDAKDAPDASEPDTER